jgi:hypothetical protein
MEINNYIKNWSEKLSLSVEEITDEYQNVLQETKSQYSDLSEDDQQMRALKRLALLYKRQLRSPAIGFEGIIIGASDCVDILAKQKREAQELFKTEPLLAISQGITDENGVPLETRKEWPDGRLNQSYGNPLPEHNYLRNIWCVVKSQKGTEPKFYSMVLTGKLAQDENIPIFKPVKFQAIDKGEKLNPSTFTKFIVDESIQLPNFRDIVKQYLNIVSINQLEEYHNQNKDNFNRLVCVEGDVSMLNLEPTAFGSRILVLEDMEKTLEDLDAKSLTCWVPERINIDFGEGSKCLVVGRTSQGKRRDEQGNATEEPGDIMLNVFGVWALPEYKINIPEDIKPISELEI